MKKIKKLVLSLGTIATIVAPIAGVVACSSSDDSNTNSGGNNVINPDSAFYSEEALAAAINARNTAKILSSIENLTLAELNGFVDSFSTEGTKSLLKTVTEEISEISTDLIPVIDKILEDLGMGTSVIDLLKRIGIVEDPDKLLEFLGIEIGTLSNTLTEFITDDLIANTKETIHSYLDETTFIEVKNTLKTLNYESIELFVKSIYQAIKDNESLFELFPQIKTILDILEPLMNREEL